MQPKTLWWSIICGKSSKLTNKVARTLVGIGVPGATCQHLAKDAGDSKHAGPCRAPPHERRWPACIEEIILIGNAIQVHAGLNALLAVANAGAVPSSVARRSNGRSNASTLSIVQQKF